jgi:hypothetical protein
MDEFSDGVDIALTVAQQSNVQNGLTAQAQPWSLPDGQTQPGMFSPGSPIIPIDPEDKPRLFEYPTGINLQYTPRAGFGLVPFKYLRNLADGCEPARFCIEVIKREVRSLEWEVQPVEEDGDDSGSDYVRRLLSKPDGKVTFDAWINALLEELLVVDAPCIYPNYDSAGRLKSAEVVAGDTIRPLLDFRGRIPDAPVPAYMQVLHGIPKSWYSEDELFYMPFNNTAGSPYGKSPTEFMLMSVNLMLRRSAFHIESFTSGNIPAALAGAPESWTVEQVQAWQTYFDALITGKLSKQVKIIWVPGKSANSVPMYEFRKDDVTNVQRDEWLMKVACWSFGVSPSEFGIVGGQGLGGSGYAKSMENAHYRSIIGPITQYLAGLINRLIHDCMGLHNIEFKWQGMEQQPTPDVQATIDAAYIQAGVYTVEYVQDRIGVPKKFRGKPAAPAMPAPAMTGAPVPTAPTFGKALTPSFIESGLYREEMNKRAEVSKKVTGRSKKLAQAEKSLTDLLMSHFSEVRQAVLANVKE